MPTRAQVCGLTMQFQGLRVQIDGIWYPWFATALQCLTTAQRMQVYPQLRAAGDSHVFFEFIPAESIYDEPGQPWQAFISPDFEANPQLLLSMIEEARMQRFQVGVIFNGDNGDAPADGYPNALRQLPILVALLKTSRYRDLNRDVLYLRFWDGVFYGSAPANIQNFGTQFRILNPQGYLGIEHNPGHIPVGNGEADYLPGGMMDGYDVVASEFSSTGNPNVGNDTYWQVIGRMVRPYTRPPDQPAWDDPNPPFYLVDSPRGPRFYWAFEFSGEDGEYSWVRTDVNDPAAYGPVQAFIAARRAYVRAMGCQYTG